MSKTKISISIVSYNNYNQVKDVVECIEKFTNSDISKKIYIVDNADERDRYSNLLELYEDIEYYYVGENIGFGKGHNYVLDKLDSDFHAIVNPDILFKEDVFSKLIDFMQDDNIGMCIPKILDPDGKMQDVYRRELTIYDVFVRTFCKIGFNKRKKYHTMQDMDYSKPFQVPFGQGSFLVIRTKLYKELNGFDGRYFMYVEDADLCKRVNQVSKIMYCPYVTVTHKWEKGSRKSRKLFKYHLNSMRLYFKKWGYKFF